METSEEGSGAGRWGTQAASDIMEPWTSIMYEKKPLCALIFVRGIIVSPKKIC